jgi:hypothetical protein
MDDAQTIFIGQGGGGQLGKSVERSLINRVGGAPVRGLLGGPFRGR